MTETWGGSPPNESEQLRECVKRIGELEAEIDRLRALNGCPYVRTSGEGTSYCALASGV